ncbi:MAG: CheR family methyltransferase [Polyangia bacterium]|jgi:chemotaxis methyl-accepting protein methylase
MSEDAVPIEVVRSFRSLGTRHFGLDIPKEWEPLVSARIAKQLQCLDMPLEKYLYRLYNDKEGDEIMAFWELVRPRPAGFFARWRDYARLRARVLHAVARGQRRFRFWSAGCGSGEEAYGMVLTARHAAAAAGLDPDSIELKILATDISPRAIEAGKRGIFEPCQVARVPGRMRGPHFHESCGGVAVSPAIRSPVVFRRLNLAQAPLPMTGIFDAIFCHEGLAAMVPEARMRATRAAQRLLSRRGLFRAGFAQELSCASDGAEIGATQPAVAVIPRSPGDC